MIHVFYCMVTGRLSTDAISRLMQCIPASSRYQILKFRKWEDMQRALLAKCLLVESLKSLNLYNCSLKDLQFTTFNRPFFPAGPDFNISHSGQFVICAFSDDARIGIDIEEIKDIPLRDFDREFSTEEMENIQKSNDSLRSFYNLWTKKEAFLKAIGKGLSVPLSKVSFQNDMIAWDNDFWYLTGIVVDQNYASHVCINAKESEIRIKEVFFG